MDLSLKPDQWNRWIYDPSHPNYDSEQAHYLRERRMQAIAGAPQWMIQIARFNDSMREAEDCLQCGGMPNAVVGRCICHG